MSEGSENQLFNAKTRIGEAVPQDQLEDAVLSGSHGFAKGSRVNVIGPDGKAVSVPSEQAKEAIGQGYKIERPDQSAVRKFVEENDGIKGAAMVAGGKFTDEFLLGIPGLVAEKKADPLSFAKWEGLKKEHEVAKVLGATGGVAAGLLIGAPLFRAVGKAGEVVSKLTAAPILSRMGIESSSQSLAKKMVAQAAEKATALGTEGVILSAPHAMTEAYLGDPDHAAETLMIGGGVGAGLGLFGGAAGAVYDRVKKAAAKSVEAKAAKQAVKSEAEAKIEAGAGTVEDALRAEDADPIADWLKSLAPQERKNAAEIRGSFERLGLKPHEGAILDSPQTRQLEATLADSPSLVGSTWRKDFQAKATAVESAVKEGLGEVSERTAVEAGANLKAGLLQDVDAVFTPSKELFEHVRATAEAIPVEGPGLSKIAKNILDIDTVRGGLTKGGASTAEARMAQNVVNRFENVKTLSDLEIQMRLVSDELGLAATPGEKRIATIIRSKLDDFYENTLERFAKRQMKTPEAKEQVLSLIESRKQAKRSWSTALSDFSELGIAGKRGYSNPAAIRDALESLPPEQLVEKLFTKKNAGALTFLRERFPERFTELAAFQRQKLMDRATSEAGEFLPNVFFREYEKLAPEVQGLMAKDVQKLADAGLVNSTIPKAFSSNPSKTDIRREFREMFSIGGALSDTGLAARIKLGAMASPERVQGLLAAEQAMKRASEKLDQLPAAIERLASSSERGSKKMTREGKEAGYLNTILRGIQDEQDQKKTLDTFRQKAAENTATPDQMGKLIGTVAQAFGETGAPNISAALQGKMANAMRYLQEQMPKPAAPNPFFKASPHMPSDYELAEFNRKLEVVMDPLSVVDRLNDGTITSTHVDALKATYPKLYETMTNRVLNYLSENQKELNYKTRAKISLLLDMPLEETLTPESVKFYQSQFMAPDQEQMVSKQMQSGIANRMEPGAESIN